MKKTKHMLQAVLMSLAILVCAGLAGIQANAADTTHYLRAYQWDRATQYYGSAEESFRMSGQEYFNGLVKDSWGEMHAEFNLEHSVDSVSFVVGHIDGKDNDKATMKVYLDGVYQSEYSKDLTYDMISQNVTIPTSGCGQLKIVIEGYYAYYGLGNITEIGKHNYYYEITKVATVKNDGLITYTCEDCDDTYTEVDPAKEYCTDYLTPYETDDIDVWNNTFGASNYFSIMGVKCYRGLVAGRWGGGVALYNLGGQYNSVTFTVGHIDNGDDDATTLRVYVDGVEMRTISLTEDMSSQTYTIDTSGATQLKLDVGGYYVDYGIYDIIADAVDQSPKEHSYENQTMVEAQFGVKGTMKHVCTVCGAFYTTSIPELTRNLTDSAVSVTLSKDVYAYDGKAKKPGVTVTYDGTELKKGQDYTVSYSNNTKAGTATVTIKGKGFYKKSKKVTFSINPGKTSFSSVKSGKSGELAVVVKKNAQASGYEIQYARNSSFYYATTLDIKSKTSTTIKDLWKGETYYVRARSYKTVKGVKIYGDYSAAKQIVVKR